ncbi:hypothetical protein JNX00_20735 [Hydrogenophaga sp. YM1]|uniref:hypothetical protein n=1 Tax=Hydrogenophaga sp. YM1 TaxID=2806262 RepID=UPI00195A85F0|nr:hypothetical protein [Hydrogenophaga sp. YM1]QRR34023.1 hypothetical protein JNX00_20735 [Hydrogenophaga sp. YM1]
MDSDLRRATLAKLIDNPSPAVEKRLSEELRSVENVLASDAEFDRLQDALKTLAVLAPRFHGAVVPIVSGFVRSVGTRVLLHEGQPIEEQEYRYRSAGHLIRDAIEVPNTIRYAHIPEVVDFLLELSRSADAEVRQKAEGALEDFAKFNLHHFNSLGAQPQLEIVARLGSLDDDQLRDNAAAVRRVLNTVLSSVMEGQNWTYNMLTLSRGSVPSGGGVAEMRLSAIELLKRMYPLKVEVAYRKSILNALDSATHRERVSQSAESNRMFERDARVVLEFMCDLVPTEPLPVVQTIEHDAYWDFYHAPSADVEAAALRVRDAVAGHAEYQLYKQFVGFDGIFGDWEKLRSHDEEWDHSNTKRQEAARAYAQSINNENQAEWHARILEFAKTESDDVATFPVFYHFLELLAQRKPDLVMGLIEGHEARMRPFLIPMLIGLHSSSRKADVEALERRWIVAGEHLIAIAKSMFKDNGDRVPTLATIVRRATEIDDRDTLAISMGIAASLYVRGSEPAKQVFMDGLRALALHHDARWARRYWFGSDFRALAVKLEPHERTEVLSSLISLPELDYQTEEVLRAIGEHDIESIVSFLSKRLEAETQERADRRAQGRSALEDKFEAIPYSLHGLQKLLSQYPKELLTMVRESFKDDEARVMFPYRGGGRLLKGAFPNFEHQLQAPLLGFVASGDEQDLEFALAVLRTYGGNAPILDVCKAIVMVVPENSRAWRELAAALETTGGVWGEYGLAEAYERKRDELAAWLADPDDKVRSFAQWLSAKLDSLSAAERQRADEDIALRKYQYGEGNLDG